MQARVLGALAEACSNLPQLRDRCGTDIKSARSAVVCLCERGFANKTGRRSAADTVRGCRVYEITETGRAALRDLLAAGTPRQPRSGSGQVAGKPYHRGLNWSASMLG